MEEGIRSPVNWDDKPNHYLNAVVYGEWIGPGIQKDVAVSEIAKKSFAIFAIEFLDKNEDHGDTVDGRPSTTSRCMVSDIIPTFTFFPGTKSIDIDWKQGDEELSKTIAPINEWVMAIEANDPWVESDLRSQRNGRRLSLLSSFQYLMLAWANFTNLWFSKPRVKSIRTSRRLHLHK